MTGPTPHALSDDGFSQEKPKRRPPENSFRNETDQLTGLVIKALWASFPEEYSEEGVAGAAREYFRNKNGDPISARTIQYWLRGETLPSALHIATLVRMQPKLFLAAWLGGI